MTHENAGQSGAQDLKLYSVAFSTWNGSFSGLDHHNVLAVGSGAEDAIRRTKETVSQDAQDFKAVEIDHVMGCKIVTLDEAASMAMQAETVRLTLVNGRRSSAHPSVSSGSPALTVSLPSATAWMAMLTGFSARGSPSISASRAIRRASHATTFTSS